MPFIGLFRIASRYYTHHTTFYIPFEYASEGVIVNIVLFALYCSQMISLKLTSLGYEALCGQLITNSFCISTCWTDELSSGALDLTACGYVARAGDLSRNTFERGRFHVASYRITKALILYFDKVLRDEARYHCLKCQSQRCVSAILLGKIGRALNARRLALYAVTCRHVTSVNF